MRFVLPLLAVLFLAGLFAPAMASGRAATGGERPCPSQPVAEQCVAGNADRALALRLAAGSDLPCVAKAITATAHGSVLRRLAKPVAFHADRAVWRQHAPATLDPPPRDANA